MQCPHCDVRLDPTGWLIPGMRSLAELHCPDCDREFYGDLPVGFGILYPKLIDKETGAVHPDDDDWHGESLRESYANRTDEPVSVETDGSATGTPVFLNTLDHNYGHVVIKLLNVLPYLEDGTHDTIVMVPSLLRWLVPEETTEVWSVDIGLTGGDAWHTALADTVASRLSEFENVYIASAHTNAHPADYDIERFSGVAPFSLDDWAERLDSPTITVVWRPVNSYSNARRFWCSTPESPGVLGRLRGYANLGLSLYGYSGLAVRQQHNRLERLLTLLREELSNPDLAVAGLGEPGGFPDWVQDLRFPAPDEEQERKLCERYADSHVIVGIHGSNMVLPSAHAGATVEIVPHQKWGNLLSDILFQQTEQREGILRHRFVSADISPETLTRVITGTLKAVPKGRHRMEREWTRHDADLDTMTAARQRERTTTDKLQETFTRDQ
jgi:hypothetical protein